MTNFSAAAADYLATRRSLGYKLAQQGQLLTDFASQLDAAGVEHLRLCDALGWATQPADAAPIWWAAKLGVIRGFARYLATFDSLTEIPPAGFMPEPGHRIVPYIYSDDDIALLLSAAGRLQPEHRADTYQCLIAFLWVSGARVGEAVRLDRSDVDLGQGLLTIRNSKFGRSRQLPMHPTTVGALADYASRRVCRQPRAKSPAFFTSTKGTRLIRDNTSVVFRQLVRDIGLSTAGPSRPPRLHDLRHSFCTRTLIGWYRDGLDVESCLPLLSTYVGHSGPASTYWYLSAVPELITLLAERLDTAWEKDQ